jgi:hypothetical protein
VSRSSRRQIDERLAAELAAGKTVRQAASAAEVSERTAHRRLENPAFRERVAELRAAMIRAAAGQLVGGMTEAVGVLRAGLTHDNAHVQHKSAVKLIELGVKITELSELEERMNRLEEDLKQRGEKP